MAVTVKRAIVWRTETANTPGTLAETLRPFANAGASLDIVMGYSFDDKRRAAVEVYPVTSEKTQKAARAAGFAKSGFPCLVVTGPNRAGLGHRIASALADAGININFFLAQAIGARYTGLFSFEAASEADLAAKIIRKATNGARPRRAASRRPARQPAS